MSPPAGQPEVRALAATQAPAPTFAERILVPFFDRIEVDPEAAARLREAYGKGWVVHTMRTRRLIDPLYLRYALHRLGLPRPTWGHDHFTGEEGEDPSSLVRALEHGRAALLFLKRAKTLLDPRTAYSQPHIEALVQLQRQTETPILVLPETVLWTRRATRQSARLDTTVLEAIFGDRDAPGWIREVLGFLWHHRHSRFHVGAPVDLQAVLEREEGQSDRVIAKKVRWSLLHHLTREEQIRTGPMQRRAARTRQMVLKDPQVKKYIQTQADKGKSGQALEKKADELLRGIAADMRYGWLRVLDAVVDVIWHRIYDGIVVDPDGLDRVRSAARRGPVVLVPSHKSHVDYLVLSQVFFKDNMMPPHIAAGDNLNFWPMGFIFRRSGAFFLRRSFKGDKLYATVFAAYVRRLLKEGHALEFFIEGGRSRTGKLLPPRMGMLSMTVDPVFDGAVSDVQFIPVSIGYEKIIEAGAYAKELQGGQKKKEDVTALLGTAKVLRSKYGRVYVDFAEPISLRVFSAARGVDVGAPPDGEGADGIRRNLVTQLGHRIVYGINDATRCTPTSVSALILLSRTDKGLAQTELFARADRMLDFLEDCGARLSPSIARGPSRQAALREALGRFAQDNLLLMTPSPDGETIYQVTDGGRRALDYYKNNILHFFTPHAIVAWSVLRGPAPVPHDVVLERARRISRLLKFEFSFRTDRAFEANFQQASEDLVRRRTLDQDESGAWHVTPKGRTEARELAGMLAVFFEAYRLMADLVATIAEEEIEHKRLLDLALEQGNRRVLEGAVQRAEAAAQPLAKSALSVLGDLGVTGKGGRLKIEDDAARVALIDELTGYLDALR